MVMVFGACRATPPPSYRDGWRLAGGAHVGYARIDAEHGASPEGIIGGARIEVFRSMSPVEFGGRLSLGESHVDSSEVGFDVDADVTALQLDGVFRWLWHTSRGELTPWAEVFFGGGFYDADVDLAGTGTGSVGASASAIGMTLGGGAGTEFVFDDYSSLSVGAEFRYSMYDSDVLRDATELNVLGTFMIVHRW